MVRRFSHPLTVSRRALASAAAGLTVGLTSNNGKLAARQEIAGSLSIGYEQGHVTEPFIASTAEALLESHPAVEIELEPFAPGSYSTQLLLQLSMGGAPDVFMFSGAAIAELASSGLVSPLDSWLEQWEGWQHYSDSVRSAIGYDGSTWGLPYPIDTHFLYYRKDLFEQAGLPIEWMPEHPAEIIAAAKAIRNSVPDVIPYALYAGANGGNSTVVRGFIPLVAAFGGTLTDENGLWIIDSCPIRTALQFYEQAYQVDEVVPQDVMTGASPVSAMRQAMGDGSLGILYEGCWTYQPWLDNAASDALNTIGFVSFPGANRPPFSIGGIGNCWFINAACENPDLAWEFIAAFNSRDNHVALNSVDAHIPARTDAAGDPVFQETPFLRAMVATADALLLAPPDPAFRDLVAVVQNATGIVASGQASPEEAVERYASELTRILGEDRVVSQSCE